jgi:NAD(P)H-quinone oxidoreductase subunit 5
MARTLQPHLFAGFYLDALFTRMTFVVWPPRIPPRPPLQLPELTPETQVS